MPRVSILKIIARHPLNHPQLYKPFFTCSATLRKTCNFGYQRSRSPVNAKTPALFTLAIRCKFHAREINVKVDKLWFYDKITPTQAEVAELADALGSGLSGLTVVRVQVPPSALIFNWHPIILGMPFILIVFGILRVTNIAMQTILTPPLLRVTPLAYKFVGESTLPGRFNCSKIIL